MPNKVAKTIVTEVEQVVDSVDKTVSTAVKETNKVIEPVRRSVIRRFPTLFILLVTFGVAATMFGFELLLTKWAFVYERPWLILSVGVGTLILTGTLYKKLG